MRPNQPNPQTPDPTRRKIRASARQPVRSQRSMLPALAVLTALMLSGCASNDGSLARSAASQQSNCIRVCGGTMRPGRSVISNEVREFCLAVRAYSQQTGRIYDYARDPRCGPVR